MPATSRRKMSQFPFDLSNRRTQVFVITAALIWAMLTLAIYHVITGSQTPVPVMQNAFEDILHNVDVNRTKNQQDNKPRIGCLVMACNRTQYLMKSLQQLVDIRIQTRARFEQRYGSELTPNVQAMLQMPIVISFDCHYMSTLEKIQNMVTKYNTSGTFQILKYPHAYNIVPSLTKKERRMEGYFRIARHYRWALEETFRRNPDINQLIIVEDDLNFSPDFFEYFFALSPLLAHDPSLICISAWNDNGKKWMIDNGAKSLLYRTDFFPGLGWMLQRSLWEQELKHHWPRAFWDDWLRHWQQMRNRTCIRPEVSRTSTIGKKGVSKGQFFETHLQHIHHSEIYVPFFENQTQLFAELNAAHYHRAFHDKVYKDSEEIHPIKLKYIDAATGKPNVSNYRLTYYTRKEFESMANMFGLMSDFKFGVPRTGYAGVVTFMYRGYRVYIAPPITRKGYIKEWN